MYASLLRVPVWVRVAVVVAAGALLFVSVVSVSVTEAASLVEIVGIAGVLAALVVVVLPAVAPELSVAHPDARHLTSDERRRAVHAAVGGEVPEAGDVRDVALDHATSMRDDAEKRWQPWGRATIVCGVAALVYLAFAVTVTVWWALAAVLFAALPALGQVERRRAAHRLEVLRGGQPAS